MQRTCGVSNVLCLDCGAQGPNGLEFKNKKESDFKAVQYWGNYINLLLASPRMIIIHKPVEMH